MYVSSIKLVNYRNYDCTSVEFDKNINIIYGKNAQGKTNLLESIYLFSAGKSHRTNKDRELIHFNKDYANIQMFFTNKDGEKSGEMILSHNQKKRIKINGVPIKKIGELMGFFIAVLFSPEDLNLVKEGPVHRRRFLDICISQIRPAYFFHLQQYMKVLEQRNNLIKRIYEKDSLMDTLSVWDQKLVEHGSRIMYYRISFIENIKKIAKAIHSSITKEAEILEIEYVPCFNIKNVKSISDVEEEFYRQLKKWNSKEIKNGITLIGPHRDDISFLINGTSVRNYGSQGQQRTVVLSLKMAEMEFIKENIGEYPVLLLDDIMSELDSSRQSYILGKMEDKQVIITCTDVERFKGFCDAKYFKVEKGNIQKGGI
ncbi:MAG: DNA replication/repair protein RecF [Clostridiaceae bacterium]|nr:DNA replication/repair protein RecF [Clostridiaceae bacterium]